MKRVLTACLWFFGLGSGGCVAETQALEPGEDDQVVSVQQAIVGEETRISSSAPRPRVALAKPFIAPEDPRANLSKEGSEPYDPNRPYWPPPQPWTPPPDP